MKPYLETLEENRKRLMDMTQGLTVEQFNFVPPGHNNNIIWNLGHLLAVSENILYKNSGIRPPSHDFDITLFGRGTKPDQTIGNMEISKVRDALLETVKIFKENTNDTGHSIEKHIITEQALQFLLFHEDIHYRTIIRILQRL